MVSVTRVVIDSSSRNVSRFPSANDFEAYLDDLNLEDVVELRLVYACVPFPEPHVAVGRDVLHVDDAICTLTRGTFADVGDLCNEVTSALRRDVSPAMSAYVTPFGRVAITADVPFTLRTIEPSVDRRGFPSRRTLQGSAASVLGFSRTADQAAVLQQPGSYVAVADHAPLATADGVAIVKVRDVHGVRSDGEQFDRALAVLHAGRAVDALPVSHRNDPPCARLRSLRVSVCRRDGTPFDLDGRDVTLHLDVVTRH